MELAKEIQFLAKRAVIEYEQELDGIVDSNCREKCRIERTLDGMLDFGFDKDMVELFRKLCRYYYAIDQNAAAEYVLAYRDMWDSREKKEWLKGGIGHEKAIEIDGVNYGNDNIFS